ncbi:alanyl-tRNA editing protein [Rhodobacteraceae bacterium RKSG542]|uniref:alanyl-tRNA editing protein n=1 Tax=Pseudovibrio flavus TaxID=2529854 RepID=UPI0012BC12B4|nr:alanyl-tRNA editing protein [Pseudovibrio flavus]MTI17316.1 alanyl-tRNA editing protein [Pseudovibrio flavus]
MSQPLFIEDAYLRSCEATVTGITDGGVILDRTIFYPTGGGQPGDSGALELADGTRLTIVDTVKGENPGEIIHVLEEGSPLPKVGDALTIHIDWEVRYKRMRVHTAMHLLSVVLPYAVPGGQIADGTGRLDFNIPEPNLDKDEITNALQSLVDADHPVTQDWITDKELEANPELVKTMSVKPPMGTGRVRLVKIGEDIDLQPCGGTHVSNTAQIGRVQIGKIEKKGKLNRRVRLALLD